MDLTVKTPIDPVNVYAHRRSHVTFCRNMKLLILDLDETLIHGRRSPLDHEPDFIIDGQFYIYRRPHLESFLRFAFAHFKVAVWTSASEPYAKAVLDVIIPKDCELEFVWSNKRCTKRKNLETWDEYWVKNLNKVKKQGYNLESVLMIDDTPHKLSKNYGNYIQVSPFEGADCDDELLLLVQYLPSLFDAENVRTIEKRGWKKNLQNQGMDLTR